MHIIVVGLNHTTTPIELRERLHFPTTTLEEPLEKLAHYTEGGDRVILSTCNRVELYGHVQHLAHGSGRLQQFLSDYHGLAADALTPHLYSYHGEAALRHLFRVASSLDSLVLGEPQIAAQVKEAFAIARRASATSAVFNQLFERAFAVAKRVRTETRIGEHAVSVSYAAVELAKKIFQDLSAKTVLILGAGEMSELTARHLISHGVQQLLVANRTPERALELAERLAGQGVALADLPGYLPKADIVVSSTGSSELVIRKADVQNALKLRKNRPMFFIDIAVPRDIDPAVNELDNVYVYDIDDLRHVVEENRKAREREAAVAETIIAREVEDALKWFDEQQVVPAVIRLRRKAETIRNQEIEKLFARLGPLSDSEREAIEAMASSIINKLLHTPIVRLKQESQARGGGRYLQALRDLFSLDE
ncbi:MAG TPA: glutamyl-tRNA reductase [Candidatus Tectomicrobia bacterium]|nr:glutamyl-tRNA reductase [Candidatus Tectomicrobia bacterium]